MAITVSEKYKGRTRDALSAEVLYLVVGTGVDQGNVDDEDAFDAVSGAAPPTWDGIPGSNIEVREELVQGTIWLVAVTYGSSSEDSIAFPQATVEYEFSFQAPAEHIYQSLETIAAYAASGPLTDKNLFGGAINVRNDNGEISVEGLDLPPGSATTTYVYSPLTANITDAYQRAVEAMTGDVNAFAFKNRPAGTMRLVSCDGGALFTTGNNRKWKIRYAFQFSPDRFNFTAGGIAIPFKGGHHLQWGFYQDEFHAGEVAPANNGLVKKPKFIFIERVFHQSNFNILGL